MKTKRPGEPARTVAEAVDGAPVRLSGAVRLADHLDPLRSPIGERPCAYFAVRAGAAGPPERVEARDFYLDDPTGSALVALDPGRCEVWTEAHVAHDTMTVLDADIEAVSKRLRDLKREVREGSPQDQRALVPRRRRLRELATLLCSMRAHLHGKVHGGRRTRAQQAELIRRLSARFEGAEDIEWIGALQLAAPRHEVILAQGQQVTVEGVARQEPDPDPSAARSYRGVPLRLVVRPPADGPLLVTGAERGGGAPRQARGDGSTPPSGPDAPGASRRTKGRSRDGSSGRHLALGIIALAAVAGLIYWLLEC